jgi:hypothetical protein
MKTAPRLPEPSANFYPTVFRSLNGGLEYVLDAFPTLYKRALAEIQNYFIDDELRLVIDTFNATMLTPGLAGQHIGISVADAIALDSIDRKWGIDADQLIAKIAKLTTFQSACLEIWANGFWYAKDSQKKTLDIDTHIRIINPENKKTTDEED